MPDNNEIPNAIEPAARPTPHWPRDCDKCYVLVEPPPRSEPKVITKKIGPKICPTGTVENHSSALLQVEIDKSYFLKGLIVEVHSSHELGQQTFDIPLLIPQTPGTAYLYTAPYMILWYDVKETDEKKVVSARVENWSHTNSREFWLSYAYVEGSYQKLP